MKHFYDICIIGRLFRYRNFSLCVEKQPFKLNKTALRRFTGLLDLKEVLQSVSLTIKKGEKIAFVSESGSGKSTLIKILVGLLKYEKGDIFFDGEPLKNISLENTQLLSVFATLDKGLETRIGEKGTCLSGEEKQRLALARLWFDNPDIVVLDEATSALDNVTESIVMKNVLEQIRHATVIAVAHRLTSIREFD